MNKVIQIAGLGLVVCLISAGAEARSKPVRSVSLSTINVAPRGVPGPIAGAGLPALLALGGFAWRAVRRGKKQEA